MSELLDYVDFVIAGITAFATWWLRGYVDKVRREDDRRRDD